MKTARGEAEATFCVNHEGKKVSTAATQGKYRMIGDEHNRAYCSKCSIELLQQGMKVEEATAPRVRPDIVRRRK